MKIYLNYIVDNCYTVQKRVFTLLLKTFLTSVFVIVTTRILLTTGRIDKIDLNNTTAVIFILISPKLVSLFTQNKIEDEIKRHQSEIESLYIDYNQQRNKVSKKFEGDICFVSFKACCSRFAKIIK